jgi:D-beta-D-heptose 7-phosphate kinase/D-beta-D-heptose 1-phosphate adenosyltransferase
MLEYAKSLGDHLLVCIDTDTRVKELKGIDRPINNQTDRAFMLQSLKCVDKVWLFDSTEELEFILTNYRPDIMVKGSDYRDKPIVGAHLCKDIKFYELVKNYSTTKLIQRITDR